MNARVLILCLLLPAAGAAADLRVEAPASDVRLETLADGRMVRTWSWGVLTTAADQAVTADADGLTAPLRGDVTVHGPRDAAGRAPLVLLADGLTLAVHGDASFRTRDDATVVGPPDAPMHPGAAIALFLAILILTALMLRQTRKSLAGR